MRGPDSSDDDDGTDMVCYTRTRAVEPVVPAAFCVQQGKIMSKSEQSKQIGECFVCKAPIYAGEPRRGIWRLLLPSRIVRTCQCFYVILYSIQHSLVTGAPMSGVLGMMPRREDDR